MRVRDALPSAVLFDMDGTLLDTEPIWFEAEISVAADLGFTWTDDDQAHCLGGPLERVGRYLVERSRSSRDSLEVSGVLLARVEQLFRSSDIVWRPGAVDLLRDCLELDLPTALVTASSVNLVDAVHDRMAAELGTPPFDVLVTGDVVPHSKPHPAPYLMAAERLSQPIRDCLALEDSPTGVRSAWMSGCWVVAIPHIAQLPDDLDPHVVDTLHGSSLLDLWAQARRRED